MLEALPGSSLLKFELLHPLKPDKWRICGKEAKGSPCAKTFSPWSIVPKLECCSSEEGDESWTKTWKLKRTPQCHERISGVPMRTLCLECGLKTLTFPGASPPDLSVQALPWMLLRLGVFGCRTSSVGCRTSVIATIRITGSCVQWRRRGLMLHGKTFLS